MTAQHTPGPVFLTDRGSIGTGDPQKFDRLKIHSPWVEDAWDDDAEADANMRRLVACWNACAGIDTDHLEQYGLPGFAQTISDLRAQRDELLAALQNFVKEFEGCYADGEPAMIAARAAIQKATNKEQA